MIVLVTVNHNYTYELSDIIRMYFGKEEIKFLSQEALEKNQSFLKAEAKIIICTLTLESKNVRYKAEMTEACQHFENTEEELLDAPNEKQLKHLAKKTLYKLLSQIYNKTYPWGILSGIRPIKIVHKLMDKNMSDNNIESVLRQDYLIAPDRADLALEIAERERTYISQYNPKKVSVYVGIPFCPSRCHYCSFTSNSIQSCSKYVQVYVDKLLTEIKEAAVYMKDNSFEVETVYIGGGTPTSLTAQQLEILLSSINDCFGNSFTEFTCEAGRPDTITEEKLHVLKNAGVSRLSINPQTMNDETLKLIGRAHSVKQIIDSFRLARRIGFNNINMDIILGLPGETMEHLRNTLISIKNLDPESITVHTMAVKRASILNEENNTDVLNNNMAEQMMEYTKSFMKHNQMHPYYLYRQKHMVQNLENIGYCKEGFECIYNIQIIEERQTNVAFGADAVTKLVTDLEAGIERQHNIKELKLYIDNVEAMIQKKLTLLNKIQHKEISNS